MRAEVTYRLLSLEFRGFKKRAMFIGAILHHYPIARQVVIDHLRTPKRQVRKYLYEIGGRELATIRYQIIARDPKTGKLLYPAIMFCHPFPKGANVRLRSNLSPVVLAWNAGGQAKLILARDGGLRFFSDNFTLSGLTDGRVDSNQPAYQFHE